jgi:hypothetical protein
MSLSLRGLCSLSALLDSGGLRSFGSSSSCLNSLLLSSSCGVHDHQLSCLTCEVFALGALINSISMLRKAEAHLCLL